MRSVTGSDRALPIRAGYLRRNKRRHRSGQPARRGVVASDADDDDTKGPLLGTHAGVVAASQRQAGASVQ